MRVSPPFARILSAGRAHFNTRVAEARRRSPGFDGEIFAAFLVDTVDPLISAIDAIAPERTAPVALLAYDNALALATQRLLGPQCRYPLIGEVWSRLFPRLARQIADEPKILGMLSNAALYLDSTPNLRGADWLQHMLQWAPMATNRSELRALGQVLAWRAGAAHFRAGALDAADTLPASLAIAAVGAKPGSTWLSVRDQFMASPWWAPDADVDAGRHVGDFTGFGGTFSQPPEVRGCASGFWVKSGNRFSLLIADVWGAVLHPASPEEFSSPEPQARQPVPVLKENRLLLGERSREIDLPAQGLSLACNATTAAVTSIYSHQIHLFPLQ